MHSYVKKRQISKPRQEVYRKKRKIINTEQEFFQEDRISNLPDDILLHILSFIPIRCAARTSVLSTRWESLWTWNPSLDFSGCKPTDIDQCLCLYRAPKVHSFHIQKSSVEYFYKSGFGSFEAVEASDRWVRFAAMHRVEELSLGLVGEEFPASLLECQRLSKLMLQDVKFDPSGDLGAFKSLVTLCLHGVMIKNEVLNMLISTCDLLENLQVTECIFGEVLRPRVYVTNHSKLRNFEISFYYKSLHGLEIVAPDLLFLSCRRGHIADPSIPPLSLSWDDDALDWRRRVSGKGKICVKTQVVGEWLFQVHLGPSNSFVEMRYTDQAFFCQFHLCSNK